MPHKPGYIRVIKSILRKYIHVDAVPKTLMNNDPDDQILNVLNVEHMSKDEVGRSFNFVHCDVFIVVVLPM